MRIQNKCVRKITAALIALSLICGLLSGCGSDVDGGTGVAKLSGEPGGGKWIDSDVRGYVKESEIYRERDDFAAAANKDWIVSVGTEGFETAYYSDAEKLVKHRYRELLEDESITGENADALRILEELTLDREERNRLGVEPIRPYINEIQNISSIDELTEYQASPEKNPFRLGLLMPTEVGYQIKDVSKSTLFLEAPELSLGESDAYLHFGTDSLAARESTEGAVRYILGRLGYSDKEIKNVLKGNYKIEQFIAKHQYEHDKEETFEKVQNTRMGVQQYLKGYPLPEILDGRGYRAAYSLNLDYQYLSNLHSIYNKKNLENLKDFLIIQLITKTAGFLDEETAEQLAAPVKEMPGAFSLPETDGDSDDNIFADMLENAKYKPAMDTLYIEKYVSDEEVAEYEEIVSELKDAYKDIIDSEDWLSDKTKAAAKEKLENMVIHVIKPNNTADYSSVDIRGYETGGNLVEAAAEGYRLIERHDTQIAADPEWDRGFWDIYKAGDESTTVCNSYYIPTQNAIYLLAGWTTMGEVIWGDEITYEERLGCVGGVAGHEISHGFDSKGSHYDLYGRVYDENGDNVDWMEFTDRTKLDERADKLAGYFSMAHPIRGQKAVTGSEVKDEAIADMGAVKAALAVAKKRPDFDYDDYFRAWAALWSVLRSEELELMQMDDVHPLYFHRINITLQQYDEFLETYDVQPGDGMYLAPEKRVNVW